MNRHLFRSASNSTKERNFSPEEDINDGGAFGVCDVWGALAWRRGGGRGDAP